MYKNPWTGSELKKGLYMVLRALLMKYSRRQRQLLQIGEDCYGHVLSGDKQWVV